MVPSDAADVVTSVVDSISEEAGIFVLGLIAVSDEFIPDVIVVETSFVVLTCDVAFIVEFPNSVVSTDNKVMVVSDDVVS